tara:strand:+ start:11065 stop:11838 length:774 start_codon:yes stop_codon:yes gene_type:complete
VINFRVIPSMLLIDDSVVKGKNFKNHTYVGDPINILKIYNKKEVDELLISDIGINKNNKSINFDLIETIVDEAFMPIAYGGGINNLDDINQLFNIGIEKVVLTTIAFNDPDLIQQASNRFGAQSIAVGIDVKKDFLGRQHAYVKNGSINTKMSLLEYIDKLSDYSFGELIVNNIDREGTFSGIDLKIPDSIVKKLNIPLLISGGTKDFNDIEQMMGIKGLSGVIGGAIFTYYGKHRAVLPTYLSGENLEKINKVWEI